MLDGQKVAKDIIICNWLNVIICFLVKMEAKIKGGKHVI